MKKLYIPLEFDEGSAFNILCEVLGMQDIVSSEEELFIHNGAVCRKNEKGEYEEVDERADLFAALRNVACATWPNLEYRGDNYITHYCDGEEEEAEWEDCIVRGLHRSVAAFAGTNPSTRIDTVGAAVVE